MKKYGIRKREEVVKEWKQGKGREEKSEVMRCRKYTLWGGGGET